MHAWMLVTGCMTIVTAVGCSKASSRTDDDATARLGSTTASPSVPSSIATMPAGARAAEVCRRLEASGLARGCKTVLPYGPAGGPMQFDLVSTTAGRAAVPGIVFTFEDDYGYEQSLSGMRAEGTTVGRDGKTRVASRVLGSKATRTVVVIKNELSAPDAARLEELVGGLR